MNFNHFDAIAEQIEPFCGQATTQTALSIVQDYAATAPRETGEMAESGYVVSATANTYPAGSPTRKDAYFLPQVEPPGDKTTAIAAVAMNYAIYPELGTVHQAPQPAFYPAVDRGVSKLEDDLSGLEDYIRVHVGG